MDLLALSIPRSCFFLCFRRSLSARVKGNGDHSEVRDKFCSNFQNMLMRSL